MTPTYINFDKKHKREDKKFLKYKIIAAVAGFLILLAGVFYLLVYSPLLRITQINMDTNALARQSLGDGGDLINNLKSFFVNQSKLTKFLGSDNILVWNIGKLGEFEKGPEIAEISLKKDYIERTIEIDVKLRERFGVWCLQTRTNIDSTQTNADTSSINKVVNSPLDSVSIPQMSAFCYWFDKNGVLFAVAPEIEGNAINKIDDFSGRDLKLGDSILGENLTPNLIKIFNVLENSGLGIKALKLGSLVLQEIVFEQPQTSLPKIYFSLRFDPEFVSPAIENLKKTGLEKIIYVDFRVENRVYYKLK